ncbi:MAG: hypothetical protein M1819_001849 [Sarea resinae]|nr:MAG: hypothetical protein M1819_001849 [Sarea resinae]
MTSAALVGSTGLVGSNILQTLLNHPGITTIPVFSRRTLTESDPYCKLRPVINTDTTQWISTLSKINPPPHMFISALGTTRAIAGGLENQRKVDYDLNLDLARAAKKAGARVYVLISSASSSSSSRVPYSKMKGELEEAVQELGFQHTVLVRPGLIVGGREDSRPPEAFMRFVARFAGAVSGSYLKDGWAQDADVIAKAAVHAGLLCLEGKAPEGKTWIVGQADVVRLGRTEWVDEEV